MKRIISAVCALVMSAAVGSAATAKDDGCVMITAKYNSDGVLAEVSTTTTQLDLDEVRKIYAAHGIKNGRV